MTHYTQLQAGRLVDENLRLRRELDAVKKERDEWRAAARMAALENLRLAHQFKGVQP